jgi:hypothetical protein
VALEALHKHDHKLSGLLFVRELDRRLIDVSNDHWDTVVDETKACVITMRMSSYPKSHATVKEMGICKRRLLRRQSNTPVWPATIAKDNDTVQLVADMLHDEVVVVRFVEQVLDTSGICCKSDSL